MYQAIVFLPLLGAIIAALISLAGARARHPGGTPASVPRITPHARSTTVHAQARTRTRVMRARRLACEEPGSSNRQRQARAPPSW